MFGGRKAVEIGSTGQEPAPRSGVHGAGVGSGLYASNLSAARNSVDGRDENRPSHVESRRASQGKVLICDDEYRLTAITAQLLEEFGFDSVTAATGDEAVAALDDSQPPDVLLLDINLSAGLSAFETLNRVAARGTGVPVVLTSGYAAEDVPQTMTQHPVVVGYLAKPYSPDSLLDKLREGIKAKPAA